MHPYCLNDEKREILDSQADEGWEMKHNCYLISTCKVIEDKDSLGLFRSG